MCQNFYLYSQAFIVAPLKKMQFFKIANLESWENIIVVVMNTVLFFANFIICLFFDKNTIGKY